MGRKIFLPRAEWAAKIFPAKTHLTPLPPPVINNDRSLMDPDGVCGPLHGYKDYKIIHVKDPQNTENRLDVY